MTSSQWVSALATFLSVILYGAVHSFLASPNAKSWSRSVFGQWHDRSYRLVYNLLGGLTFLPVLLVAGLSDSLLLYQIPIPWLWLTLALQAAAVVVLIAGVLQTGASEFLGIRQALGQEADVTPLIRSGLYRWVRHPLYTAGLVLIWLTPIMSSNLLSLNLGLTLYLYAGSIFEENKLLDEYGEAYRQYQQAVPRLIPFRGNHASKSLKTEDNEAV